jgi:hypothetical protein
LPGCVQAFTNAGGATKFSCRRLGNPLVLPNSP